MTSYEFHVARTKLEPLTKTVSSAQWREFAEGRRALILSCSALLDSDFVEITPLPSSSEHFAGKLGLIAVLLEPPDVTMLAALETVHPRPGCIAWPGQFSAGSLPHLQPAAVFSIGDLSWAVAIWSGRTNVRSADDLTSAPDADVNDLVEDLDARSRWFKKRH